MLGRKPFNCSKAPPRAPIMEFAPRIIHEARNAGHAKFAGRYSRLGTHNSRSFAPLHGSIEARVRSRRLNSPLDGPPAPKRTSSTVSASRRQVLGVDRLCGGFDRFLALMHVKPCRPEAFENGSGARRLFCRPMRHDEIVVALQNPFICNHAVFRDADAIESGAQRADTADHDRALYRGNGDDGQVAKHDHVTDDRHEQK